MREYPRRDHDEDEPKPGLPTEPSVEIILFIGTSSDNRPVYALGWPESPHVDGTPRHLPLVPARLGPWRLSTPTRILCARHDPRTVAPARLPHLQDDAIAAGVTLGQMRPFALASLPVRHIDAVEQHACALRAEWAQFDGQSFGEGGLPEKERQRRAAERSVGFVSNVVRHAVSEGWMPPVAVEKYKTIVAGGGLGTGEGSGGR